MTVSEMVSAKALCYNDLKTKELLQFEESQRPIAVQIFGSVPEEMAKAAKKIEAEAAPDLIDINMGCPAPKITRNFSGSTLMRDPDLARRIIEAVCGAVATPVIVKIRKGWDDVMVNAISIGKIAQEAGAAGVTIHGRTRKEMFSGKVDLKTIAQLKENLNIPVIGNGDVDGFRAAREMYDATKCDLVMIGRAALGRPWVFAQIKARMQGLQERKPDILLRAQTMLGHGQMLCERFGEPSGMKQMRKHVMWYTKEVNNGARLRTYACKIERFEELKELAKLMQEYGLPELPE